MVETLGTRRVAIGTDMDYTYKLVMASYRQWPPIASNLLRRGMIESEVAAIMGGNADRLMGRAA